MSERGQIRGGVVDGPLAMDNARPSAAKTKGIHSLVAGRADNLVVPNIESGNILAKELTYVAQAQGAGLVLGAKAPVLLTSRADDDRALLLLRGGLLYAHCRRPARAAVPAPRRRAPRRRNDAATLGVTLNAGSSSIKFALFEAAGGDRQAEGER